MLSRTNTNRVRPVCWNGGKNVTANPHFVIGKPLDRRRDQVLSKRLLLLHIELDGVERDVAQRHRSRGNDRSGARARGQLEPRRAVATTWRTWRPRASDCWQPLADKQTASPAASSAANRLRGDSIAPRRRLCSTFSPALALFIAVPHCPNDSTQRRPHWGPRWERPGRRQPPERPASCTSFLSGCPAKPRSGQ